MIYADSVDNKSPTGVAPVLQVHPSRRCNLTCAHCYSSSGPGEREELHIELLSHCLEDAVTLGYRQLAVSGGEPLLYGSLVPLLAKARSLGMVTTITTNGMLATHTRWKALSSLIDVAAISIDGKPEGHDALRRCDGAFASTVGNLKVIRASGVAFGFIFTLTQYNVDSLEFVVRLAHEQGARSVQVHPLTLNGRATTKLPDSRPDAIELVTALLEASRLGSELGVAVHVDALTVAQLVKYHDHVVPRRPVKQLVDVAPVLVVQTDGRVVPLTHEVSHVLHLGSLSDSCLSLLAHKWIDCGKGDKLVAACERTWLDMTKDNPNTAVYWYDEVAARTRSGDQHSE
jgi:Fe-coproporphyrin III synthase